MSHPVPAPDPFAPSPDAVAALRLIDAPLHWTNRLIDRLNPIFVKETRQALKSRQFLGAFFALLLLSWLISAFAVLVGGANLEYSNAGRDLFAAYFVVLAGAILVVVPYGAYRSLLSEREDATFEPLIISTLSPRQIVLGKLASAMLQAFLYYSAIAPFIAFTSLLQGFDLAHVSLILGLGLLGSLGTSTAALAVSSMISGRVWQSLLSLAVLGGLISVFSSAWGLAFATRFIDWTDPWFVWGLSLWIVAFLSYLVLFQQIAVSNLTFRADNRSTGLRLIVLGQWVLLWICVVLSIQYLTTTRGILSRHQSELVSVGIAFSLLHWAAAGLFFAAEEDGLSHRIIRRLPRSVLLRAVLAPVYPGGSRGLLLTLLGVAGIAGIVALQRDLFALQWLDDQVLIPLVLCLYLATYLCLTAMIARWGLALGPAVQPLHCRVVTLIVIACGMVVPIFALLILDVQFYRASEYPFLCLSNPFLMIDYFDRGNDRDRQAILQTLIVVTTLMITANLPAITRGIRELIVANPNEPDRIPR